MMRYLAASSRMVLALVIAATLTAPARADADASKVEYYDVMSGVTVVSLSSTTSSAGMVVYVSFANSTSRDQNVYYRVVWLDASDHSVATGQPWNMTSVSGNSTQTVSLSIEKPEAANYRLQISLGKHF